jgi:uncharacterized membrane protein
MTTLASVRTLGFLRCFFGMWLLLCRVASSAQDLSQPVVSRQVVRFSTEIQPVFNQRCVMCHQAGSALGGLSLEPKDSYKNLVGSPSTEAPLLRVASGLPDKSYLWHKLSGTHVEAGGSGNRMPLGGEMPADEMTRLRNWIEQGAKRN